MITRLKKYLFLWKIRCLKPLYPKLASFFEKMDDKNCRLYFSQATQNYEREHFAAALLNLNMALYLDPQHFGALILRGRILIKEEKFDLASNDFLRAFDLSPVRFFLENIHLESLESFPGLREITIDINDTPQSLRYLYQDKNFGGSDFQQSEQNVLNEWGVSSPPETALSIEEKLKFDEMGPITQDEIETVDWNRVFK